MTPESEVRFTPTRVSMLARITPALSYALPALGAAVSAWLFIGVMRAMRNAESAGIAAVTAGLAESNIAVLVGLYLAIIVGLAGVVIALVRIFATTQSASPSGWYFFITALIGFAPVFTLWRGQSLLLEVLFSHTPPTGGVAAVAREISLLLLLTIGAALVSALVLLVSAVVPLPRIFYARRKWAPAVAVLIMEALVIAMTVAYHLRTAWLYAEYQRH